MKNVNVKEWPKPCLRERRAFGNQRQQLHLPCYFPGCTAITSLALLFQFLWDTTRWLKVYWRRLSPHQHTHIQHTHTHIWHTRTRTHTHARTHAHTRTHTHTHTRTHIHTRTPARARTHTHTHTYTYIHTRTHTHIHTRTHARTHTHTHTYTHTHTKTNKQNNNNNSHKEQELNKDNSTSLQFYQVIFIREWYGIYVGRSCPRLFSFHWIPPTSLNINCSF